MVPRRAGGFPRWQEGRLAMLDRTALSTLEIRHAEIEQTVKDMLAVGVYMHTKPTEDEVRRALYVLSMANYDVKRRAGLSHD